VLLGNAIYFLPERELLFVACNMKVLVLLYLLSKIIQLELPNLGLLFIVDNWDKVKVFCSIIIVNIVNIKIINVIFNFME